MSDQGIAGDDIINRLVMSLPETNRHLIQVRWTPNTGPYRKLIPALREAGPDDLIVTADDDIFYGEAWLASLMSEYESYPDKVVAGRVRQIRYGILGAKTSYMHWGLISESTALSKDYIVTFGGGAVLSKAMFREQDIYDDRFIDIAPRADDLWYSKLLTLSGQQVKTVPAGMDELFFMTHPHGLAYSNLSTSANSLLAKALQRVWVSSYGALGGAVCGNDYAFIGIERYYERS
ncbi:hypothetical protein [Alcanivorax sp.]|uniref:hypothetical protein n=1 Tax=Alcanivorax sp. TaxID=1872427 RepID=UPI0032D96106